MNQSVKRSLLSIACIAATSLAVTAQSAVAVKRQDPSPARDQVKVRLAEVIAMLEEDDLTPEQRAHAKAKLREIVERLAQQSDDQVARGRDFVVKSEAPPVRWRLHSQGDGDIAVVEVAPAMPGMPGQAAEPPAPPDAPLPPKAPRAPKIARARVVEVAPEGAVADEPVEVELRRFRAAQADHEKQVVTLRRAAERLTKERAELDVAAHDHVVRALEKAREAERDAERATRRVRIEKVDAEAAKNRDEKPMRFRVLGGDRAAAIELHEEADDEHELRAMIDEMRAEMSEIRALIRELRSRARDEDEDDGDNPRYGAGLFAPASTGPAPRLRTLGGLMGGVSGQVPATAPALMGLFGVGAEGGATAPAAPGCTATSECCTTAPAAPATGSGPCCGSTSAPTPAPKIVAPKSVN